MFTNLLIYLSHNQTPSTINVLIILLTNIALLYKIQILRSGESILGNFFVEMVIATLATVVYICFTDTTFFFSLALIYGGILLIFNVFLVLLIGWMMWAKKNTPYEDKSLWMMTETEEKEWRKRYEETKRLYAEDPYDDPGEVK